MAIEQAKNAPLYRAFISYSHRDAEIGDWIHKAIENYKVPNDLIGRQTARGVIPTKLRPVFRDRFDLSASSSLQGAIEEGLLQSEYLIVLCSMASAKSPYVDGEIRRFKALGRSDRILPLIVDGEPHDPERECFPPALRFKIDAAGALTNEPDIEPIAADAREHADGRDLARLKIIAGLLGVRLDDVRKREVIAERARRRLWMGIAGCMGGLAVVASVAAAIAVARTRDAERRFELAFSAAVRQVKRIDGLQDQMGVSEPVLAALMADALGQLDKLTTETGAESDNFHFNRAEAQLLAADLAHRSGQLGDQLNRIKDAIVSLEALATHDEDNMHGWSGELAAAYERRGEALMETKNVDDAMIDFAQSLAMIERIATRDQASTADKSLLATAYAKAGNRLSEPGQADQKIALLQKAITVRRALASAEPSNVEFRRALGVGLTSLARAMAYRPSATGADRIEADALITEAVVQLQKLADAAPRNADLRHVLGNAISAHGDVLIAMGRLSEALADYLIDLKSAQTDASENPQNIRAQLDYAVSLGRVGLLAIQIGRADEGLKHLEDALVVESRVAAHDRVNAELQDLPVNRAVQIAVQLKGRGDFGGAASSYRRAVEIRDAAAQSIPTNGRYVVGRIGERILFSRFLEQLGRKGEAIAELLAAQDIARDASGKFDVQTEDLIGQLKAKLDSDLLARQ